MTLTGLATLGSIFLTPLNFAFWGGLYEKASNLIIPIEINPWQMLQTVVVLLGIPMLLGILFARQFPRITQRITRPIKILSIFIFAGFVVVAFSNNFQYFIRYIHLIFLIVLAHNALALLSGYTIGTLFNLSNIDRKSVTIETGIQNSGLALVLIFNPHLFGGLGGMAFVAAWWGIWHIIAGMSIAGFWSNKSLRNYHPLVF